MALDEGPTSPSASGTVMPRDHREAAARPDATASAPDTASCAWEDTDATAGLAPSNLTRAKVQRAWERRPRSPYGKGRFKVGKIFKRHAGNAPVARASGLGPAFAVNVRQNMRAGSPVKAVKKMRVARDSPSGRGAASLVSHWECRGSPALRRIVTRSCLGKGDLVALADHGEPGEMEGPCPGRGAAAAEVEGTSIELLNEDGTPRNDDEPASGADAGDWEDESDTEVDEDEDAEEEAWERCRQDARAARESMSPDDAIVTSPWQRQRAAAEAPASVPGNPTEATAASDAGGNTANDARESASNAPEEKDAAASVEMDVATHSTPPVSARDQQPAVLPEGFVSPALTRRRRPVSQVKQGNANRRRTLPNNFVASERQTPAPLEAKQLPANDGVDADGGTEKAGSAHEEAEVSYRLEYRNGDGKVESALEQNVDMASHSAKETTPEPSRDVSTEPNTPTTESQLLREYHRQNSLLSPSKLPGSPIPAGGGNRPRLPLRRSPGKQRQSSSPVRRKSILKSTLQKSHLIAFTPVKMPAELKQQSLQESASGGSPPSIGFCELATPALAQDDLPVRSSSAPPEEPQMSPRKPKQPRISDDTALLEAFLKRASESKFGRQISDIARRRSLENRRDSDTVRQALASPAVKSAPSDVLADLDPNSPSPRKQPDVSSSARLPNKVGLDYQQHPVKDDENEPAAASDSPRKVGSRKSSRAKRKPETLPATTYDGKTKIQIRTNSEGVVLKKMEAQKRAAETKKNTQLNKKGAVMPPLRLTKMAAEKKKDGSQEAEGDRMDVEGAPLPGSRGVRWADALVYFYEGDGPDMSSDELGDEQDETEPMAQENHVSKQGEMGLITAPPAHQTPSSKPKLRRLKPPKPTASNSAKPSLPLDVEPQPKVASRRKVSSIATPAKLKRQTSLGPADECGEARAHLGELAPRPTPMPASVAAKKAEQSTAVPMPKKHTSAATRKRGVAGSKLPAPSVPPGSGLAAGKESSLIASPPKKRATKAWHMAAAAPLKLGEAQGLASQFDLSKAALKPVDKDHSAAPSISSPAKKAPRTMPARSTITNERRQGLDAVPGLASPAKKRRTRGMPK